MSLLDVDPINADRGAPSPNQPDTIPEENRMSHNTLSSVYSPPGQQATVRMALRNNMIVFFDSANRVSSVYGYISSVAPYPVQITALPGYDVFVDILGLPPIGTI